MFEEHPTISYASLNYVSCFWITFVGQCIPKLASGRNNKFNDINWIVLRDEQGKGRFNGYSFKKLLFPGAISVFER